MAFDIELTAALDAAGRAAGVILEHAKTFEAIDDPPVSISTAADRAAQEVILAMLSRAFPADAFCAEEATESMPGLNRSGPRTWVIDPIDGTRGFATKNGEYSVMIGLLDADGVALGVVLEPAKDRLTYAVRGGGAWKRDGGAEPVRCRVTTQAALSRSTLTESRPKVIGKPTRVAQLLNPGRLVQTYSAGIKLALVARGEADVYLNTYDAFHDWDICAGHALVSEAGGAVTDLQGNPLVYARPEALQAGGLLATNGLLHADALRAMHGAGGA